MTARQANPSPRAIARHRVGAKGTDRKAELSPSHKKIVKAAEKGRVEMLRATSVDSQTTANIALKSDSRPLTEKQKLFIKHWAAGDSILGAAHHAGYADSGALAYRMVKDPAILKVYNEEKRRYEESVGMTRQKVMDGFAEAIEMAKVMADPNAMIAGWREVGKMCGYFAPVAVKVDVNINDNSAYGRLNRMSDAELLELVQKDRLTIDMDTSPSTPLLEVKDAEDVEA